MAADPLETQLLTLSESIREAGRREGRAEVTQQFFGEAAIRLTGGLFAVALHQASQQLSALAPAASQFFAAKAQEFTDFATPPSVASISPADGTLNVGEGDQVVIHFAVRMDEASVLDPNNVYVGPASGGAHLNADRTWDAAANTLTIKPVNAFSPGVSYTATVTKNVLSFGGQMMGTDYVTSFTTRA